MNKQQISKEIVNAARAVMAIVHARQGAEAIIDAIPLLNAHPATARMAGKLAGLAKKMEKIIAGAEGIGVDLAEQLATRIVKEGVQS